MRNALYSALEGGSPMPIGLDSDELETMIKKGVLVIMDSRLSQSYERLVKNIAAAIYANNEQILSQLRAAGMSI